MKTKDTMTVIKRVPIEKVPVGVNAQILTNGLAEYKYERPIEKYEIVNRILQYADKHGLYLDYYPGCSEPGYDDIPVLAANWNPDKFDFENKGKALHNRTSRLEKLVSRLEKQGILSLEWSDEWSSCSDCGKAVRITDNSYHWTESFVEMEGGMICRNCWSSCIEDIIDYYKSTSDIFTNKALPEDFGNLLIEAGWAQWDPKNPEEGKQYETGFHAFQNDDPRKVFDEIMKDSKDWKVCFVINDKSQFSIGWVAYVRKVEKD